MDDLTLTETDWKLINYLTGKPHPNLRDVPLPTPDPYGGLGEVLQESRVAHHLLDFAGVPRQAGRLDSYHLDARVALLLKAAQRLQKLAALHQPDRDCDGHGGNSGFCVECGWAWPCASAEVASGERDDEL